MKTPNGIESVESSMEYCKTQGISIFSKLQKSMGSDDILYGLVSKTVWQSPFELALIWINMVAKEEWSNLADNPTDNLDTRNHKLETRKHLHFCIMAFLSEVNVKPTMLQKLTTRLFVSEKLASTLPTHDQDRVLASALMLPYKKWKQVL